MLFHILGRLNRTLTNLIITTVEQLEYIAEHGCNIGAIDFLDN